MRMEELRAQVNAWYNPPPGNQNADRESAEEVFTAAYGQSPPYQTVEMHGVHLTASAVETWVSLMRQDSKALGHFYRVIVREVRKARLTEEAK